MQFFWLIWNTPSFICFIYSFVVGSNCPIRCGIFHEDHNNSLSFSLNSFSFPRKRWKIPNWWVVLYFCFDLFLLSLIFLCFLLWFCFRFHIRIRLLSGKLINWKKPKIPRKFQFVVSQTVCITPQIQIASSSIWMASPMAEPKNPPQIPELQYVFSLRFWIPKKIMVTLLLIFYFSLKKLKVAEKFIPKRVSAWRRQDDC